LRAAARVHLAQAPVIENDFIERREVLVAEGGERPVRFLGTVSLPELFQEVVSASSVEAAAHRSALGFDRAYAAIEWLYRSGYLEPRAEDEL
jgi:hypothetical protein